MTEHPLHLWYIESTDRHKEAFHVLACCLDEAVHKANDFVGEGELVMKVEFAGCLAIDGDDDDDEDEVEGKPVGTKAKMSLVPAAGSN